MSARTGRAVAVIDIGSNSGRVVVYQAHAEGYLRILASSRASLRLVRELDETHRLSDDAVPAQNTARQIGTVKPT